MPSIIECDNCGYSRSSEDDERMFETVCGICYLEQCATPTKMVELCYDCVHDNIIIDPGESLLT